MLTKIEKDKEFQEILKTPGTSLANKLINYKMRFFWKAFEDNPNSWSNTMINLRTCKEEMKKPKFPYGKFKLESTIDPRTGRPMNDDTTVNSIKPEEMNDDYSL